MIDIIAIVLLSMAALIAQVFGVYWLFTLLRGGPRKNSLEDHLR